MRIRSRWRLELQAFAAALLTSTVVSGVVLVAAHLAGLGDATDLRWFVVVLGSFAGVLVWATYRSNRGVES